MPLHSWVTKMYIFRLDKGSIVHVIYGIMAGVLGETLSFTLIFIAKQLIDIGSGEDHLETSGDLCEYAAGLIIGTMIKKAIIAGHLPAI